MVNQALTAYEEKHVQLYKKVKGLEWGAMIETELARRGWLTRAASALCIGQRSQVLRCKPFSPCRVRRW